jgi:hypothetical protein
VRVKFEFTFVAIALICCTLGVSTWLGIQWWHKPEDFEQCSERAKRTAALSDERTSLIAQCDKQFVGRRKMGGGYTYYDFLQNRHFDIAGPNPTPKELKHFDEEYALYLDALRRDAVAATLAERQTQRAQTHFQSDQYLTGSLSPLRPPMVITPTNVPKPEAGSPAARSKGSPCDDASLGCGWVKFSAGIKNIFGSYAKVTP